eukprot:12210497-Karenia_brevis.AAC.1
MLDFLASFGTGYITKCISSHTDDTAIQSFIQTFTEHCTQMGHPGVQLKIPTQGQSQASGGGDASDQAGIGGSKRDLSPSPAPPGEPHPKDAK